MLLLCALVAGSTSVWAVDVTINFGTTTGYWAAHTSGSYEDSDSRTWSCTYDAGNKSSGQAGYSQFGNSSNVCKSLEFTATVGKDINLTSFSVSMIGASASTAGKIYLYKRTSGGVETQLATASVSGDSQVECSISSNEKFSSTDILKVSYVGTAKAIRITKLSYSYTLSASNFIDVSGTLKDVSYIGGDVEFTIGTDQTLDDNPTQFYTTVDGDVATSQPSWIDALYDEGTLLLSIAENPGAARTAYFRVEKGSIKSDVITINQLALPAGDPYTLFAGNLVEGDYVIYYDGYAMNTTVSSDRLQYEKVTPSNNVIITEDASIVWHIAQSGDYWTIYNKGANAFAASTGVKNKAQMLASGTDDQALWTVSGTTAYEFVNKKNNASEINANLRNNGDYGFACYASGTGGALSLYKKLAVKLNANGYATFSCTVPIDFSKAVDFTAWQVTGVSGTTITFTQVTDKVAANTGVLLMGTAGETVSPFVAASGSDISSTNKLVATTTVTNATADKYYGLSGNEFVKVNAGEVSGGKALLPTDALDVKALSLEFEGADGINAINPQPVRNNAIYDLSGRRVAKATKGLYIVNGKKVVK